jgi:hypothetical protein
VDQHEVLKCHILIDLQKASNFFLKGISVENRIGHN